MLNWNLENTEKTDYIKTIAGTVVGWGFDETGKVTEQLTKAHMPVVSQETCIYSFPDFYSRFTSSNTFCAGYINGKSHYNKKLLTFIFISLRVEYTYTILIQKLSWNNFKNHITYVIRIWTILRIFLLTLQNIKMYVNIQLLITFLKLRYTLYLAHEICLDNLLFIFLFVIKVPLYATVTLAVALSFPNPAPINLIPYGKLGGWFPSVWLHAKNSGAIPHIMLYSRTWPNT